MEEKQKSKKGLIVIAIILLFAISIGYASISTELKINGTAMVKATSWNVYFTNVQPTNGSVSVQAANAPATSGTTTTELNYAVTLEKPGDYYEFTVDVKNGGSIDAKIAENNGVIKAIKTGTNENEIVDLTEEQAKLINYTVTYADDSEIKPGDKLAKNGTANNADTKTLKVRIEYKTEITAAELNEVNEDMTLKLLFGLIYIQD